MISDLIQTIDPSATVLIAGPTASGKSALALAIAETQGGTIVNADASQVFDCWRVLTARPSAAEEARAPHALYGHVAYDAAYSVGDWLREVAPILGQTRPIIVGGTGLYFTALTTGLAEIPPVPPDIRREADGMTLDALVAGLSPDAPIDLANRARVQRAWEVQTATGRPLHEWQKDMPSPLLPRERAQCFVLDAPKEWLTPRIAKRFDLMLETGGLDEARAMRKRFDHTLPSCRAIGVAEALSILDGTDPRVAAYQAVIRTRQYAKRQRTWFRSRLLDWQWVPAQHMTS